MKMRKGRLISCIMLLILVMSFGNSINAQEVVDVSEKESDVYQVDVFENRNALVNKMIDNSVNGSGIVNIGDNLTYRYQFSCSENNFSVGYRVKENGWTKTFYLTYDYETDLVNVNFQQIKNSNFYAARAEFVASKFTDVYMITFKDATASDYGSMCVTYAENFAKIAFPNINNRMIASFDSSLCKIGFISYAHEHSGGSATCVELAKCKICGKEYGELNDHETELVNTKQETYYEEGYTGDQVCTVCGKIVESGTVIPKKERIEATGKFALVKSFLLEKGQTDDNGNKYFHKIEMITDKLGAVAIITYIEDEAKFQFTYGNLNNNRIESTIAMFIEENGSQTVTVDYSHITFSLNASATFDVTHYTSGGKEYFEKTSSNILDNSQIQDICNATLESAFAGWDMLLLDNFGFDVNMADMGFTSYEEAGTHTGDGVVTKQPTCVEKGIMTYTCVICGHVETEEIDFAQHQWKKEYTIDKAPTNTETGTKSIHCSICNNRKNGSEQIIPKLGGAANNNPNSNNNGNINNNATKKSQTIKVNTSKKISVKKLKKKAQSFKLSAKSTSGSKVKYKLVKGNKKIKFATSSGKITVKKGTKKGTYRIKVKMTVSENNQYHAYSTTKTITIKVK